MRSVGPSLQFDSSIWLPCSTSLLDHSHHSSTCFGCSEVSLTVDCYLDFNLRRSRLSLHDSAPVTVGFPLHLFLLLSIIENQHPDSSSHPPLDLRQPYKCSQDTHTIISPRQYVYNLSCHTRQERRTPTLRHKLGEITRPEQTSAPRQHCSPSTPQSPCRAQPHCVDSSSIQLHPRHCRLRGSRPDSRPQKASLKRRLRFSLRRPEPLDRLETHHRRGRKGRRHLDPRHRHQ